MSAGAPKPSSLASLPPPKSSHSASSAAGAVAAASPGASARKSGGGSDVVGMAGAHAHADTSLLEARLAAMEKRFAALAAVKRLPAAATPAKAKANTNALVGRGILAQLRDNAGLADGDDDVADEISDTDADHVSADAAAVDASADAKATGGASKAPIARSMLSATAVYGSFTAWVKQVTWKNTRNKFECEAIAQAIDALRLDGISDRSQGLEILCRRLGGVHLADQHNNWSLAEVVAFNPHGGSLMPRDVMTKALKEADTLRRLTANTSTGSYRYKRDDDDGAHRSSDRGRGGGRGGRGGGANRGGYGAGGNGGGNKSAASPAAGAASS